LLKHFGFTVENVVKQAKESMNKAGSAKAEKK
jgi:hypothetical protein